MTGNSLSSVVPYETVYGDVELDVIGVVVDGSPVPLSNISTSEHVVTLHNAGRKSWGTASFSLRASVPDGELSDGPWKDVRCVAVLTEDSTNSRVSTYLKKSEDGVWLGQIEMSHTMFYRRASLDLAVVGTIGNVAGRLIGASQSNRSWFIDVREKVPVRQREPRVEEVDFRRRPNLQKYSDSLCLTDTTAVDAPVVYLNTGAIEGLIQILNSKGGTVGERLTRKFTIGHIAQDAWTAMFYAAISDLDADDDGAPLFPQGWKGAVLRTMLPEVMRGYTLIDGLYRINQMRVSGEGWDALQADIGYAIGKRTRRTRKLTEIVRSLAAGESVEVAK